MMLANAQPISPIPSPMITSQPLLVAVTVNHHAIQSIAKCYRDNYNHIWIAAKDLHRWGIIPPPHVPVIFQSQNYYQLNWYRGIRYQFNPYALKLTLNVPPHWLLPTTIRLSDTQFSQPVLRPTRPGLFFNYDLHALYSDITHSTEFSGVTELAGFNHWGIGTTDILWLPTSDGQQEKVVRLNTTWTLDQPEHLATWRFGDSITSSSEWSGAVRFGGIQYATNFATQPHLITFPLPSFQGEAVVPTNVNVFVNSVQRQSNQVNPGPFEINQIPVITGSGTVSVVTKDILGRQQVTLMPYYASAQLLRPGLSDFSLETGFTRNNYGIKSFDYQRFVSVGTYRRGITPNMTMEGHAEVLTDQQTVGLTHRYLWQNYGIFTFSIAGSHLDHHGFGGLSSLGFHRQAQHLSFGGRIVATTSDFTQVGLQPGQRSPALTSQVFIGYNHTPIGSFSTSYTEIRSRSPYSDASTHIPSLSSAQLLTVNYSRILWSHTYLTIGGVVDFDNHRNNEVFGQLVWALGHRQTFNTGILHQDHRTHYTAQLQKNLPLGNGWGYHLLTEQGDSQRYEGSLVWQNRLGTYSTRAEHIDQGNNYELSATGGAIRFGNKTILSRATYSSFALVEVPGFANVRVYYRNQLIGRTDKTGTLFIPNLLPYEPNDISINAKDLPLDTTLGEIKHQVIPYFRSGVLVLFNVKKTTNAVLQLQLPNHQPVPAGATVQITHQHTNNLPVGYAGEVYLSDLTTHTIQGRAYWNHQQCVFNTILPKTHGVITDLGHIICQPIIHQR